jgi:RNA polymerase sigma-70 factor (ECF subfamily)
VFREVKAIWHVVCKLGRVKLVLSPDPDAETRENHLMASLQKGEAQALSGFCSHYRRLLHTVAMSVVHNSYDAEEVLQDVFLHVWNRAANYSAEKGKVTGWIVMLTRRRAIDRLRQQGSYRRATDRYESEYARENEGVPRSKGAQEACLSDLRTLLKQQLQRLPPAQKQVIEMTYFDGLSQREIAAAIQQPLGTVKTRIELGLRKLANMLVTARLKIS